MRPILHGDLVAAARVLVRLAPADRPAQMQAMQAAADLADRYRRRLRRPHPRYGGGSLMAASAAWPKAPEPWPGDAEYLRCLAVVIAALLARRDRAGN
jgi:hypothetical protein